MTALLTLLNLNELVDNSSNNLSNLSKPAQAGNKLVVPQGPPVWKVLVLDQYTKDVLATVLRVQDLRDVGVTLHVYDFARLICRSITNYPTGSFTPQDHHCQTCQPYTS
jgi:hypothetical protein